MKSYIKLMRIKHYIKNFLVFLPMFFAGDIFNLSKVENAIWGFVAFCLLSSAIYIFNDLQDVEKDRNHPKKKERPIASGAVPIKNAIVVMICCMIISILICLLFGKIKAVICLFIYLIANILYSLGLKNKPIIDVAILASGFVIRVFFGGFMTDVKISQWLYLVIVTGSLYMGLGKRRNELMRHSDTREVLKYYTNSFLNKNMYVCVALTNVFYALWTIEIGNELLTWTVPIFTLILMCYSLDTEGDSDGDPVEVILNNKLLLCLGFIYFVILFCVLYCSKR